MEMSRCTAGFARLDITPPLGVEIGGYFTKRVGKGVLDPLYVRAAAFGDGERSAVLLAVDQCSMKGDLAPRWAGAIADKLGLSPEAVMLHCTHSHTTPLLGTDEMYDQWLLRRLCDAAALAMNDRKPVADVQWTEGEVPGITFVRRFFLKDGTVMTNPSGPYREQIDRPASENDESIRIIRILRREGPEIALVNFQTHPDNIGGEYYSADYPGALCATVERLRENTCCLFLNGAQGQMISSDRRQPKVPASHERAMAIGVKLGEAAAALFDRTVSTQQGGLSFGREETTMKTKRDSGRYAEAKRIRALFEADRVEEIHPFRKQALYLAAEAKHLVRLEEEQLDYAPATVCAMTFCGVALAGFPGEPFNEVGKLVRRASTWPVTCACCLVNGSLGYFPMDYCFEQGGYEVYNTPYVRGTAEQLADTAIHLLASL